MSAHIHGTYSKRQTDNIQPNHEAAVPKAELKRAGTVPSRVTELLEDKDGRYPVWVRAPKTGLEKYSSFGRSKLYELAGKGYIRSCSIREPGKVKGTRLFNLESILSFIARCEAEGRAE